MRRSDLGALVICVEGWIRRKYIWKTEIIKLTIMKGEIKL